MAETLPVITIQCDWNDVLKLPKSKAWISVKYLNTNSVHEDISTAISDGKIKLNCSESFQYISHSNLSLVLKHLTSGLKAVFVAPTKPHKLHDKGLLSIAAAENALSVSSCEQDKLLVWDSRTSDVKLELKGHGGPVYKCRFFPSGIVVLSAGADGSCRVWSAETGVNPVTLKGHTMAVMDISIVEKGRNVISVSRDGSAKLWDVGESSCLDTILEGLGPINCCTIALTNHLVNVENEREVGTGNKLLAVGCESGLVVCTHVGGRQELFRRQLEAPVNACTVLQDCFIVGCSDGKIHQLSIQNGSTINVWHESANPVLSIAAVTPSTFAVGRQDGTCTIISTSDSFKCTRVYLTGSDCDGIRDIAFNGKWIFTACRDTIVRKYDYNQVAVHFK